MPEARLARTRQSLPPDYVYEPPREMVHVPFVQLVDVAHLQGQVTISTTRDSAFGETWIEMLPYAGFHDARFCEICAPQEMRLQAHRCDSHPADASSTHEPGYGAGV